MLNQNNDINNIIIINKFYKIFILLILYANTSLIIKNKSLLLKTNQSVLNTTKIVNIPQKKPNIPNIYDDIAKSNLKLYNASEHPYFSIIIHYKDFKINDDKITDIITNLLNQTFIDIQIIIFYNSTFADNKTMFSNFLISNKSLELYPLDNMILINKLSDIINIIKGKYLIVLNESLKFNRDEIYKAYNITKGKINNIFNYSTTHNSSFYVIRTKILRTIFDKGFNLNNFEELINCVSNYPLPQLNYIPISFSTNNLYTTLTYTSMLSILITKEILYIHTILCDHNKRF